MKFAIAVSAVKPWGAGRQRSHRERGTFYGLTSPSANQWATQTCPSVPPPVPGEERGGSPDSGTESPWLSWPTPVLQRLPGLLSREETSPPPGVGKGLLLSLICFRWIHVGAHHVQALEHGSPLVLTCFLHLNGWR